MSTLTEKDIERGTLIWHHGRIESVLWDCPAVITIVDREARTFRIRSLYDMQEQEAVYSFDINASSPTSRKSMRVISKEEARKFIERQIRNFNSEVHDAKRALEKVQIEYDKYRTIASELGLHELKRE